MHYLTICAIVKDEDPYLEEWIRYHQLLGVEHFYLFDNESRIPLRETLAPFIAEGLVDVEWVDGHARQLGVYTRACRDHPDDCRWMAMIDIDEFLVPHRHESLRDLLELYEKFGGLAINWQVFGPSGHQTRPPGLQIAQFTKKMPIHSQSNQHVKTITQTDKVMFWRAAHYPRYKAGHWSVNECGDRVDGALRPSGSRRSRSIIITPAAAPTGR